MIKVEDKPDVYFVKLTISLSNSYETQPVPSLQTAIVGA
jgi:hypothetical protein